MTLYDYINENYYLMSKDDLRRVIAEALYTVHELSNGDESVQDAIAENAGVTVNG